MRNENFYALISSEKETILIQQIQSTMKIQDSNNNNDASYISSEQDFAVLIK